MRTATAAFGILVLLPVISTGADFQLNTGGQMGFEPDLSGSSTGWGSHFVATALNDTGQDVVLTQLGFPCSGDTTGAYGWVVWLDVGAEVPPEGAPSTADHHGMFVPVEGPGGDPTVYTYVEVWDRSIVVEAGTYFTFGYQNTGQGGQTTYNGFETWSWDQGMWIADSEYFRTAVMEVTGDFWGALEGSTWGGIKNAF